MGLKDLPGTRPPHLTTRKPLDSWLSLLKEKARPCLLKGRSNDWEHTLRALEYGKTLIKTDRKIAYESPWMNS
jgi:hypothetical protein